jgi:hypothetical protein
LANLDRQVNELGKIGIRTGFLTEKKIKCFCKIFANEAHDGAKD